MFLRSGNDLSDGSALLDIVDRPVEVWIDGHGEGGVGKVAEDGVVFDVEEVGGGSAEGGDEGVVSYGLGFHVGGGEGFQERAGAGGAGS